MTFRVRCPNCETSFAASDAVLDHVRAQMLAELEVERAEIYAHAEELARERIGIEAKAQAEKNTHELMDQTQRVTFEAEQSLAKMRAELEVANARVRAANGRVADLLRRQRKLTERETATELETDTRLMQEREPSEPELPSPAPSADAFADGGDEETYVVMIEVEACMMPALGIVERMWALIPADGTAIDNASLRDALRCSQDELDAARMILLGRGAVKMGTGRDGSVSRVLPANASG